MASLEHLMESLLRAGDLRQPRVEALGMHDRVDFVVPRREFLLVLRAGGEHPPVGDLDARRAVIPLAELVQEPLLEISHDPVLVDQRQSHCAPPRRRHFTELYADFFTYMIPFRGSPAERRSAGRLTARPGP